MKYIIATIFSLAFIFESESQVIPVETFISLLGKQLSYIDDTFTKNFQAELDVIDQTKGVFSWKKGFNGDNSQNNQYIIYKSNDSTYEFWYDFVTDESYYTQGKVIKYYDYYESELRNDKYKKLNDSIEEFGSNKAIVKNYQFEKYIIKICKLAGSNGTMLQVIQKL